MCVHVCVSMLCVQAGAKEVYGVEVNKKMVDMSRDILRCNGMEEKVRLVHSLSSSLSAPADIPRRYVTNTRRSTKVGIDGVEG